MNAVNLIIIILIVLITTKFQLNSTHSDLLSTAIHNNNNNNEQDNIKNRDRNGGGVDNDALESSLHLIRNGRDVNITTSTEKPRIARRLTNEKRLIKDLLDNYQVKWGRPVNNMSEKIVVYFGINLVQLLDLDEKNQVLITNVYALYRWVDAGLRWDKDDYGGLTSIRLPVNRIWTPDIVLYNYADTRLEEKREALAIIQDDGTITWRPPSILKSTCQIDIVKFPYDIQRCLMKFGSWTYHGDAIDIQFYANRTEISRDEYITSNEWDIIEAPAVRNVKFYSCCKEPYPDLTFYLMIKRRGGFYNYILVLPCVLLSCLTMVLFWLPPESPAKMVLGMNIFTSFFVLLLLLSKNVPSATDRIPLIGGYYCLNMVMIATSTCACTVVVHIFFRGNGRIPRPIRMIFLEFLAKIFCMVPPVALPPPVQATLPKKKEGSLLQHHQYQQQQQQQPFQSQIVIPVQITTTINDPIQPNGNIQHQINRLNSSNSSFKTQNDKLNRSINNNNTANSPISNETKQITKSLAQLNQNSNSISNLNHQQQQQQHHQSLPYTNYQHLQMQQQQQQINNELGLTLNLIENDIKEIRDYLRHTRKKLETNDTKTRQTNEWKQVALVLDRTLFFMYCIAIVVSLALMFPR